MISNAHSLNGKFSDAFCAYQAKKKYTQKKNYFTFFSSQFQFQFQFEREIFLAASSEYKNALLLMLSKL